VQVVAGWKREALGLASYDVQDELVLVPCLV
jgi:hypothetical protein